MISHHCLSAAKKAKIAPASLPLDTEPLIMLLFYLPGADRRAVRLSTPGAPLPLSDVVALDRDDVDLGHPSQ